MEPARIEWAVKHSGGVISGMGSGEDGERRARASRPTVNGHVIARVVGPWLEMPDLNPPATEPEDHQ